jgi:hypothetical protein
MAEKACHSFGSTQVGLTRALDLMRSVFAILLIGALLGCTATGQYRRAAQELHYQDQHLHCWAPSGQKDCAPWERTRVEEAACVSASANQGQRHPEISLAKRQLEACMLARGWILIPPPFAIDVIKIHRIRTCRDFYPIDACPSQLD